MQVGMLNNPSTGVSTRFREFVNNEASTTLTHGMVVCVDHAGMATAAAAGTTIKEIALKPTSSNQINVLGIVYDPEGYTVKPGERGVVMVRGIHDAVKVNGNTTISIGSQLGTFVSTTASLVGVGTAAPTAYIGTALKAYTATDSLGSIAAYLDVK